MGKAEKLTRQVEDTDASVVETVAPYSSTPLVRTIALLSEVGDQPQLRAICWAMMAAGVIRGSPRLRRAGLDMLLAHDLATEAKNLLKRNIDRTRPRSSNGVDGHRLKQGRNRAKEETSFPSGHSAGAIAVARAFARHYPEHQGVALAAAGAVAVAQIPRCAHYPSDVAAGLAVGVSSEALVSLLPGRIPGK